MVTRARTGRPIDSDAREEIDEAARDDLLRHHGDVGLGPLTVVIAAYNEADNIAAVVAETPRRARGLEVSVLVVVDGGDDDTDRIAREAGAYACVSKPNRGQGAALRLGYQLASEHGATYIATLDADGQYDPSGLEALIAPLVAREADFVSGSRRLGRNDTTDPVRRLGVVVFSKIISLLTGHRITDPANGFRAMRAEVPAALLLEESQYQASELLVAAIRHGYRVMEVPVTMRPRASGGTKKGNNLVYGYNFARVIIRTWLRER